MKDIFDMMAEKWPSEIVGRGKIEEFTGGLVTSGTMANIDCDPEIDGPPRIRYGRKIAYPVIPLVNWMRKRSEILKMEGPNHE